MILNPTIWLAAFAIYAASPLVWFSPGPGPSIWLASLVVAYAIGMYIRDLKWVWIAFMGLIIANLAFCGYIWYALDSYNFGWAGNQNYFGCAIALGVAAAIVYNQLWFLPLAFVGLWFTGSQGAIVASAIAILAGLGKRLYVLAPLLVFLAILIIFPDYPRSGSLAQRLGIWQDTINHLNLWGHGYGSFTEGYKSFGIHTNVTYYLPEHAYNDYLEAVYELGVGAAFLCIGIGLTLLIPGPRLIPFTFLILGLTYFPFHVPVLAQLFAMSLGHLARMETRSCVSFLRFSP